MLHNVLYTILGLGLFISSTDAFSASATTNLAVYWGQNSAGSQSTLATYCEGSTIDIIPLAFLTSFGTGDYTLNFANMCSGSTISGSTLIECDQIAADIETCQAAGKKILLSMGGASGTYGFNSSAQAVQVANDLWDYFGGGNSSIRPFGSSIVDGFDLDIENDIPGYYPDFIAQMRTLYASQSAKTYYISGAPQCVYPDASLYDALFDSYFDFLFIQFYNNWCGIYQYGSSSDAFNYDVWDSWAKNISVNPNVRLYLGVAAAEGAANAGTGYVAPSLMIEAAQALQSEYASTFGGVMMWDASQAYANIPSGYSINYAEIAKEALTGTLATSTTVSSTSTSTSTSVSSSSSSSSSSTSVSVSTVQSSSSQHTSSTSVAAGNVATISTSTGAPLFTISSNLADHVATTSVASSSSSKAVKPVVATSAVSTTSCTQYYTVVSGDSCYAIWTAHGLTAATFYALNPTLSASNDCLIQPGEAVCVSDSATTQTTGASTTNLKFTSTSNLADHVATTSVASSSSSKAVKPVVATSTVSTVGCTQYYTVVSGDYCYAIWTAHGLTAATFYALNPTLSASNDCLIQPGEIVCVSDSATTQTTGTSTTTLKVTSTSTTTTRIATSSAAAAAVRPVATTSEKAVQAARTTTANAVGRPGVTTSSAASASSVTGSSCPVSGGSCTDGSYQCNGYGYAQCVWGAWVLRSCPTGLACAGSGSDIYCDYPGTASVTCAGITGKTSSKRSLAEDEFDLEAEVDTTMTTQRLNSTHFVITLKARATGIMPITDSWFFSFDSEKDILSSDAGVLHRDPTLGTYTVSADPSVENRPTRNLVVRLVGSYDSTATATRKSWLF